MWQRRFVIICSLGGGGARRSYAALLPLLQMVRVLLCGLPLRCGFWGGVLAPLLAAAAAAWQPPAAKEGQGDCDFPLGPPWILLLPLDTPPLRCGVGGGRALRSYAALCRWGNGCCSAFCRCVAAFAARSCAAVGCGSSLVAASGGQGGPGGLRFPPRPSLDSPLPLETPPLR